MTDPLNKTTIGEITSLPMCPVACRRARGNKLLPESFFMTICDVDKNGEGMTQNVQAVIDIYMYMFILKYVQTIMYKHI